MNLLLILLGIERSFFGRADMAADITRNRSKMPLESAWKQLSNDANADRFRVVPVGMAAGSKT